MSYIGHSQKQCRFSFPKGNKMVLTTPQQIEAFRLRSLRQGLKLEMKGMRLTSKGKTCYAILKGMGYRGTRQQVFEAITIDSENALAEAANS
jgi:hypothetical protein